MEFLAGVMVGMGLIILLVTIFSFFEGRGHYEEDYGDGDWDDYT